MSVIVYQFQTVKFIQMMSLTFGLFTEVRGSGPLGPLVVKPACSERDIVVTTSVQCMRMHALCVVHASRFVRVITCTFMHGFQNNLVFVLLEE